MLDVDVDGKVSVHVAHLVEEAARDAGDEVLDQGADGAEGRDSGAVAMVDLNRDRVLLRAAEADIDVRDVLDELAWRGVRDYVVAFF